MLRSRLRTGCLSLPPHSRAQSQSQVQPSSKGWRQRLHLPVEETAESHAKGMDSGSKKGVGTFICISPSYPNGWCIYPSPVLISGISDLYCGFHGKAHNKPTCRHEDNPLREKRLPHPPFENRMWSVYTEAHQDTNTFGISLVVQWLRICLAMQGRQFDPWSRNWDPTGCGEAGPTCTTIAKPMGCRVTCSGAHTPQLESPCTAMKIPRDAMKVLHAATETQHNPNK